MIFWWLTTCLWRRSTFCGACMFFRSCCLIWYLILLIWDSSKHSTRKPVIHSPGRSINQLELRCELFYIPINHSFYNCPLCRTFAVKDSTGAVAYSDIVTVQQGPDSSCALFFFWCNTHNDNWFCLNVDAWVTLDPSLSLQQHLQPLKTCLLTHQMRQLLEFPPQWAAVPLLFKPGPYARLAVLLE